MEDIIGKDHVHNYKYIYICLEIFCKYSYHVKILKMFKK